jgi:cytochrome c oxidase subunit II
MKLLKSNWIALWIAAQGFFLQSANAVEIKDDQWNWYFQEAVTPVMREVRHFHEWVLLPVITAITLLVLALLIYVCFRFRAKANPNPSKNSHGVLIETAWTLIPIFILMVIAVPSVRLLFLQDKTPPADITIKAIGYQWYWGYEYPEAKIPEFSSYMLCQPDANSPNGFKADCLKELAEKNLQHKFATDTFVVAPVNKTVRVLVTSQDVIHSWAMPAFGIKSDAVPGRINQTWFRAEKEGTYYGQCSELCGVNHAFMPITVKIVSEKAYGVWAEMAKTDIEKAGAMIAEYQKTGFIPELSVEPAQKAQQPKDSADKEI